jgi:uncharacterized membrane protein YfcA
MTSEPLLLSTAVLALAGFVQGLTGFGFGMIAMGLLPLVLGLEVAQAVVTVTGMAGCLTMSGVTLRHIRWEWSSVGSLWLGAVVGVPLGFMFLTAVPQSIATRALGLAICLMVAFEVLVNRQRKVQLPSWSGYGIGLVSGALSGAFNIGGPPLVAYIFGRPWTKEEQVATLSALFTSSGIIRLSLLLADQELHADTWTLAAWGVGPMLAAIVLGNRLLKYVSQRILRIAIYTALVAIGVNYLLAGQ